MRQQILFGLFVLIVSVFANPLFFQKRQNETGGVLPPTASGNGINGTSGNGTAGNGTAGNGTAGNGTAGNGTGAGGSGQGSMKLKVIVTGGEVPIESLSQYPDVEVTTLYNVTNTLNLTQLYNVAKETNSSISGGNYKGVVIIGNSYSIESLGFLNSVVINSMKPVVVTENVWDGLLVANNTDSIPGGTVVIDDLKLIYPGFFSPYIKDHDTIAGTGAPIGVCYNKTGQVSWFFNDGTPEVLASNGTIRTMFTNFTNTEPSSIPVVPILYGAGDLSSNWIQGISSNIQGLVIVDAGGDLLTNPSGYSNSTNSAGGSGSSSNSTSGSGSSSSSSSNTTSINIPIVYSNDEFLGYWDASYLSSSSNVIFGNYLSPIKSKLLLSIAIANGVTSTDSLNQVFPR
ncbi:hypothetical protein TPHA_0F02130 [Tetrapisispora phaffii CBS 4417]|uniref:Asparaginase n=1 Tax=Tetrapisispora phaffii (strain ATCC 24235 / CBS 4417 / NBRC 1672 / NRRL Y-8282 / UCD 70-5) TaxID=1071381 RepID=G8BVB3_TETPH|nr:hypothetical protein TPHA_0F02130 [Tetrapisispora phaffii CBS 4417]CCE63695.1 hypothetical protein TPHA_0F02130 [Tetrapisispora phaffii CBS 4417]